MKPFARFVAVTNVETDKEDIVLFEEDVMLFTALKALFGGDVVSFDEICAAITPLVSVVIVGNEESGDGEKVLFEENVLHFGAYKVHFEDDDQSCDEFAKYLVALAPVIRTFRTVWWVVIEITGYDSFSITDQCIVRDSPKYVEKSKNSFKSLHSVRSAPELRDCEIKCQVPPGSNGPRIRIMCIDVLSIAYWGVRQVKSDTLTVYKNRLKANK
ncbi:MAG: hypothetical protein EZS28_023554 [Streblomastix strix]|uniref:Uncharacterized protein n=1 Tax=Streblomastix strix TaxID=222440 RepID=A0A5J4VEA2_9EUKA|nr:MAG: hypothetical protein EZS28_023554 [Streblomastix strix]